VLGQVRDRLRRSIWHALGRYDELMLRLRENHAGRSALGFVALLLLAGGAALGFIAASATAHEEITDLTPARANAVMTITRTVTHRRTVRVIAARKASTRPHKAVTITERSPGFARTVLDVGTLTRTHTVTVTEIQPVTVTVVSTETKKGKP
jgi:hypothetical protein